MSLNLSDNNYELAYRIRWSQEAFNTHRPALIAQLRSDSADELFVVLSALFKIGPIAEDLAEQLVPLLDNRNENLARLALQALGNIAYKRKDALSLLRPAGELPHLRKEYERIVERIQR